MTKHKLSSTLKDADKPNLKKTRHKISKKDKEKYYELKPNEEIEEEEEQ